MTTKATINCHMCGGRCALRKEGRWMTCPWCGGHGRITADEARDQYERTRKPEGALGDVDLVLPCPACRSTASVLLLDDRRLHCRACDLTWDDDDDAGEYNPRNPAARIEREERARARKGLGPIPMRR